MLQDEDDHLAGLDAGCLVGICIGGRALQQFTQADRLIGLAGMDQVQGGTLRGGIPQKGAKIGHIRFYAIRERMRWIN